MKRKGEGMCQKRAFLTHPQILEKRHLIVLVIIVVVVLLVTHDGMCDHAGICLSSGSRFNFCSGRKIAAVACFTHR
jgi:hypothetical protein